MSLELMIPITWGTVSMPDVAHLNMGQSPSSVDVNEVGEGLVFFQGKAEFGKLHPTAKKYCTAPKKIAEKNDILLSVRAPVGPTNLADQTTAIGRGLAAIKPFNGLDYKYLFYYFRAIEPWMSEQGTGSTFKAISGQFLKELPVAIAPLAEQKQIAAKLDELLAQVDTLKTRLDAIPAILKRFRQSVLAAAVSGRLTEEWRAKSEKGDWQESTWEEILRPGKGSFKRGPFGSALKKSMFVSNGYKVYEQYCPINDDCSYARYFITAEKFAEMKSFEVLKGDFLISCSGVSLGRITQVPSDSEPGIINQALLRVRLDKSKYDDGFFKVLFRSPSFQSELFKNSAGAAIPNLKGVKDLKAMAVPLPSLLEQKEIVRRVKQFFTYANQIEQRVKDAQVRVNHLTQSILAKAFRGELTAEWREQNPGLISGENSAKALLERIKIEQAHVKPRKKVRKKSVA